MTDDYVRIIILTALVLSIALSFTLGAISRRRRTRRLSRRSIRPFDEWCKDMYGQDRPDKELIRKVHEALAREIGVDPSQIRSTDRFSVELSCPEWWGECGHELQGFEEWSAKFLRENIPKNEIPKEFPRSVTVGDLVRELNSILSSKF